MRKKTAPEKNEEFLCIKFGDACWKKFRTIDHHNFSVLGLRKDN